MQTLVSHFSKPPMNLGRGYRSFWQMRIDRSGSHVQSLVKFPSCEFPGFRFVRKSYGVPRSALSTRRLGSRYLKGYVPSPVCAFGHNALIAAVSGDLCRSYRTKGRVIRRDGPRSSSAPSGSLLTDRYDSHCIGESLKPLDRGTSRFARTISRRSRPR